MTRAQPWLALTLGTTFAAGCGSGAKQTGSSTGQTTEAGPATVAIDPATALQTMDGFGASNAFSYAPLSAQQVTAFFDPTHGIGLSLLRVGIGPDGMPLGAGVLQDAIAASAFGVRVWAAPWSPPASDKSNDDVNNGGTLNPTAYASWANVLAGFATTFQQSTGFPLYALSAQNEPDFTASYVSCVYSPAQMVDFVKVLGPVLASLAPPVRLLAPEPDVWDSLWGNDGFGTAILGDPAASSAVGIIATHDYSHKNDALPTRPPPPSTLHQPLWETEVSDETAPDVDIGHGVEVAIWIYAALTSGGASAWHYWQLVSGNPNDGEGLLQPRGTGDVTNPPKRFYAVGNFSKFVRPGYVRIGTTGSLPPDAWVTAFRNPTDGTLAIVAINGAMTDVPLTVSLNATSGPAQVTPWVTSPTDNLAAKDPIALSAASFQATLAAQSVTTFVGTP